MVTVERRSGPITESNLRRFFHDSVLMALNNQQVEADEATIWYLANLLSHFSRSENLFDDLGDGPMLRPLAELYGAALSAPSEQERRLFLQRLGDVALFVSGLFQGLFSRRRRLVDVDYYISMGGNAYDYLAQTSTDSTRDRSLVEIYRELSHRFLNFVDVLAEVGEHSTGCEDADLLRMHELWAKTGSPRLERKLRAVGIAPSRFALQQ